MDDKDGERRLDGRDDERRLDSGGGKRRGTHEQRRWPVRGDWTAEMAKGDDGSGDCEVATKHKSTCMHRDHVRTVSLT